MNRLIGSEVLRPVATARVVLMGGSFIGDGVGLVIAAFESTPPGAAAIAPAEVEQEYEKCL